MKILVIGCKGFIGSHLLQYFQAKTQHEIWGCDVVTDYAASRYFLVDASTADFEEVFSSMNFDVCINCAGAASVPDSIAHPRRDYYLNVNAVFNMLESIRRFSPSCRFLQLSSAAVYGNPRHLPVKEEEQPVPLSPYGWHKFIAEQICKEFFLSFRIHTCAIRIFSAFGPGLRKQMFWDWFQKTRHSSQLDLLGTGSESRDFIFIDDLVAAIDCVIENCAFQADIVNVANGREVTIADAMKDYKAASGLDFSYSFKLQNRPGDPINWVADISKLKSFGYLPRVSFKEGLQLYWKWLKEEQSD